MNRIKIWLDETMATRTSIKWILIYGFIIFGSIGLIIRSCIIPMRMLFTDSGIYLYDTRFFIPLFVAGMIYSAYELADEIRFLSGKE